MKSVCPILSEYVVGGRKFYFIKSFQSLDTADKGVYNLIR